MGSSGNNRRRAQADQQAQTQLNQQFRVLLERARPILPEREIDRIIRLSPFGEETENGFNLGDATQEQFRTLSREVQREEQRRAESAAGARSSRTDEAIAERKAFEEEKQRAEGSVSSAVRRSVVRGGGLPREGSLANTGSSNVLKRRLG